MPHLVRPSRGHTTQPFGNTQPDGNPHAGEDYAYWNPVTGETFPEIFAAASGQVLFAGDSRGLTWPNIMYLNPDFDRSDNVDSSAGNYIILLHDDGEMTGYGHLAETLVREGQRVRAGQHIGICGDTGNTRGKHLHFDYIPDPAQVHVAPLYGRARPVYDTYTVMPQSGTTTPLTEQETELMAALTEEEQRELLGNTRTLISMLNNVAGFLNESGIETRDNARKIVYATVDNPNTD